MRVVGWVGGVMLSLMESFLWLLCCWLFDDVQVVDCGQCCVTSQTAFFARWFFPDAGSTTNHNV